MRSVFGFPGFRGHQRDIVARLVAGENLLAVLPTGAGKSLCYQVASLMAARPAIVVSPLIALMDDQVAGLRATGIEAAALHSAIPRPAKLDAWHAYRRGDIRLLYMSPEQLMTDRMLGALARHRPGLIAVDEAHCISKWGVSFRPDYEALAGLKEMFPDIPIAGFTATADAATQKDIAAKLFAGRGETVVAGFDRPNLHLSVEPAENPVARIAVFLDGRRGQSGIVYCATRRGTEDMAAALARAGHAALPYHAGMDQAERAANAESFLAEPGRVMVATVAFGMGIDKPDVRFVVHANLPGSVEAYYQEMGRAGRDGARADCLMLYSLKDIQMRRRFIAEDGDEDHQRREHKRLDALLAYCEATACRRRLLLSYFGEASRPCGHCDLCDDPPVLADGTAPARLLFSAMVDTGGRFGAAHLIDVLRGADTAKIRANRHDGLACHGAGADKPTAWWRAFIRQAVAGGHAAIDIEAYGALKLTAAGRAVLDGNAPFAHRAIRLGAERPKRARMRAAPAPDLDAADAALLGRLKALRRELAAAQSVPAYVVFPDATLIDMIRLKPRDRADMARVSGVGPAKLERFADAFLAVLNEPS